MQQRSEAARIALRMVAQGKVIEGGRYEALRRAGLLEQRGHGHKARRGLTEAGEGHRAACHHSDRLAAADDPTAFFRDDSSPNTESEEG